MAKNSFKVEGMKELQKSLKKIGEVPQKYVTASARKGMNVVLSDAKRKAPIETGNLKKGIKLVGEKSRVKGKKAYQVVFDSAMNDVFQKRNKNGDVVAYYPVSQEYGYFTKNGRYIPGYHFIGSSLTNNAPKVASVMVGAMKAKIDTEISKARLK